MTDYFSYETKFHAKFNIAIVPIECNYNAFLEQFKTLGQTIDAIPYILDNKDFDSICDSFHIANFPLRIAVPFKHPLKKKERLSYSDLENETIITLNGDLNSHYQNAMQEITEHTSNVNFQPVNFFDFDLFDYAIKNNHLILVGDYLKNVHPSLSLLPIDWNCTIPYGLYYSKTPSPPVSKCIDSFSEIKLNNSNGNVFLFEF